MNEGVETPLAAWFKMEALRLQVLQMEIGLCPDC